MKENKNNITNRNVQLQM